MRTSALYAAPVLAAVAYAQESSSTTVLQVLSGTATVSSTFTYTNGFTSFLTETNSLGVVTGMPEVATAQSALPSGVSTQPLAITTQPVLATIPAGLGVGTTQIVIGNGTAQTSFTIDVQSSTTNVLGADSQPTSVEVATVSSGFSTGSSGIVVSATGDPLAVVGTTGGSSASGSSSGSSTATSSSAEETSSDSAAISNVKLASAGVFGFGAIAAFFL